MALLSNATSWPYELSHVKNEFSLVGLTACLHVKSSIFKFRTPPLPLSPALIGFFVFSFSSSFLHGMFPFWV